MGPVGLTESIDDGRLLHPAQVPLKQDGRNLRRDRNKIAVVDAFLDLVAEGNIRPSVSEVAERSGVSHRSVFRYFADTDELARTSIERQVHRVSSLIDTSVDLALSTADRIEVVVARRMRFFEAVASVMRLSRALAAEQPIVQQELTNNRSLARAQLGRMFAPELQAMDTVTSANTLAAIDVLCSFDSLELLRHDQALSETDAANALRHALTRMLT
jgi:TetR/AcrR family transcriptional regulator of autoinduction and epiphytic fitness